MDIQANDLAHRAVLQDLIPLAAIRRTPDSQVMQLFQERQVQWQNVQFELHMIHVQMIEY